MSEEERANISALQVELAESQAELTEQCRLNGMGQEREARLMAQLQEAERKLAEYECIGVIDFEGDIYPRSPESGTQIFARTK
jgi:hypothetical protein